MKSYTITDTKDLKVNQFTYSEFVNHAETRKLLSGNSEQSRRTSDKKWMGTDNFAQALELARSGYDAGIKQMELEGGILANTGIEFEPSVYGSVVNMNSYLQGLPDNMYLMKEEREYNMPLLTLYVPLTYSAGNEGKKAMRFAKSVTQIVNKYQATHNIKLVGMFYSKHWKNGDDKFKFLTEVLIKDFDQRFVLNNVAFAFHPSFFRRLWFAHLEGEKFWDSSYGRTVDQKTYKAYATKDCTKGKAIMLPQLNDIEGSGSFTEDEAQIIRK